MRGRSRNTRLIAMSIATVMASLLWFAGGAIASADPPGNNGTVMVVGEDLDGEGNDSHVGCAFSVEFFGFDEGDLFAFATIEGQAPSAEGTLWTTSVFIGEDPAGGGTDHDASVPVDLTDAFTGEPHPQEGFHVGLTVNADGSLGADTKYKTFWVSCDSGEGGGGGEGDPT